MNYAVLLAVSGFCGYCLITKGRFAPGSILFKFVLVCYRISEHELVESLNKCFENEKSIYFQDFEVSVALVHGTIIGECNTIYLYLA